MATPLDHYLWSAYWMPGIFLGTRHSIQIFNSQFTSFYSSSFKEIGCYRHQDWSLISEQGWISKCENTIKGRQTRGRREKNGVYGKGTGCPPQKHAGRDAWPWSAWETRGRVPTSAMSLVIPLVTWKQTNKSSAGTLARGAG